MIALAAAWIIPLLAIGGFALDRVLVGTITSNFDAQLEVTLAGMINAADLDEIGSVRFMRQLGDQRFSEPYSGLYWQVSARDQRRVSTFNLRFQLVRASDKQGTEDIAGAAVAAATRK